MDNRNQTPTKFSSFSPATTRDDVSRTREIDRNFSLCVIRDKRVVPYHVSSAAGAARREQISIKEEDEKDQEQGDARDLAALSAAIDAFIAGRDDGDVADATLQKFAAAVELEVDHWERAEDKWAAAADGHDEPPALLASITRVAALASVLGQSLVGSAKHAAAAHRVTAVMHRAMAFLEEEFDVLLEDPRVPKPAVDLGELEQDRCVLPPLFFSSVDRADGGESSAPPYPPETVDRLRAMADAMIGAGCASQCAQMFLVARRNAFDAAMRGFGYEKGSVDDMARMPWDALEAEVVAWTKAFRHAINVGLSQEHDLCSRVFVGRHAALGRSVFADLARCVMMNMLSFTEAIAKTKRTAEKLFKVLDMYEAVRDAAPVIDAFIVSVTAGGGDDPDAADPRTPLTELKSELVSARSRLSESAAAIFRELESSIRADAGKQPVPGGAVHPLTRYVMNYVELACAYNSTLDQVFQEQDGDQHHHHHGRDDDDDAAADKQQNNPFAAQLTAVMEQLHENLEAKSRLYKDPSLSSIFLMNNGRYMLQKIRGSPEINSMLGESWARRQSTSLRQYHKNYQRETWSRVLNLFRDDGVLTVKGNVQKPALKERLKQFNATMDEIQRTQGAWVVSDEQLQSELRVSIAAVVVPAYRSFLGRFGHHFSPGRQTEKYVKLSADDVEMLIDTLFDGNPTSMARRRTWQ